MLKSSLNLETHHPERMKRTTKKNQRKSLNPQAKKCSSPHGSTEEDLQIEKTSLLKYTTAIPTASLLKHFYKSSKSAKSNRPDPSASLFEKFRDFMNEHRIEKISKKGLQSKYLKLWESRTILNKYREQFYGSSREKKRKVDIETNTNFPNEKTDQSTQKREHQNQSSISEGERGEIPIIKIIKSKEKISSRESSVPKRSKSDLRKERIKVIDGNYQKKSPEPQPKKDSTQATTSLSFEAISPEKMNKDIEKLEKEYVDQVNKYNELVTNLNEIKAKSRLLEDEKKNLMKDCNQMKDDIIQLKYMGQTNEVNEEEEKEEEEESEIDEEDFSEDTIPKLVEALSSGSDVEMKKVTKTKQLFSSKSKKS